MARTGDDTWDLASSVGATATMVAAARAMAGRAEHPLIDDPFAEPLVRAVGVDVLTRLATGELEPGQLGGNATMGMARLTDNMAVRTVFFDDFFLDAVSADRTPRVTQAVILASGLDSRAYRLDWPAGTKVFEIDQPDVIEFKAQTLAELGAKPTAELRTVGRDLREDWAVALVGAGFDPTLPSAWSAEGLLGYLPPEAQDTLLDTITKLSAPGSRLATESASPQTSANEDRIRERMQGIAAQWREQGLDLDLTDLIYFGDRNEAAGYLSNLGWQMTGATLGELFAAHGLPPFDDGDMAGYADMRYVSGTRAGA